MHTDEDFLQQLRAGSESAVATWYHVYSHRLRYFIGQKVTSSADVDELVQDTFLSCLRSLPAFAGHSQLWTWMCGIAKHEISDYYRKKYAKKVLHALPLSDWLLGDVDEKEPLAPLLNLQRELSEKCEAVLSLIGHNYRELLLEKYLDQIPVVELARRRGKTAKALESELFRARQAFKRAFKEADA